MDSYLKEMLANNVRLSCLLVIFSMANCLAQQVATPPLERAITISFDNEPVEAALKKISQQAGFTFSYNPSVLKDTRPVAGNYVNKSIRQVLDDIFKGAILYKSRGNYVILTRVESGQHAQKVSGYVVDEATGDKLKNVSIYDPVSLASAITDDYGYFQIDLPESAKDVKLAVRKHNYSDTLVAVPSQNGLVNIRIASKKIGIFADSVGYKMKRFWLTTKALTKRAIMFENIEDTLHRKFQFSFIPFVGTNHKLSGHVINDYSMNMLGGYSLGVNVLEFGGLFNTVRGNVRGAQVAGLFNAVGGEVYGAQLSGLINANRGKMRGGQAAGLINFNWAETEAVGIAGLINFGLKDSRDVRIAGLSNISFGNQKGPHVAGLFNFTTKSAGPAQVAGTFNLVAGDMKGAQVAGVFNLTAGGHDGAQIAGILNFTGGKLNGAQVGLLNYATRLKGTQVGLLNITDSTGSIPFGFLSLVANGYHAIEISADEIFYANLSFRTGVRKFYNILTVGMKPSTLSGDQTIWSFGYGLGTSPRLSRRLFLNVDFIASQIVAGSRVDALHLLNKVYLGLEWRLAKNLGMTFGITANGLITEADWQGYPEIFHEYSPHILSDRTNDGNYNTKTWLGAKVGLRFF